MVVSDLGFESGYDGEDALVFIVDLHANGIGNLVAKRELLSYSRLEISQHLRFFSSLPSSPLLRGRSFRDDLSDARKLVLFSLGFELPKDFL